MSETHITRELLEAVASGELPPRLMVQIGWQHLIELCPSCREAVEAWQSLRRKPRADYGAALRVLPVLIDRHCKAIEKKEDAAHRDLRELLRMSQATRLMRIQRASHRYKGRALAELLLTEARRNMPAQPQLMSELAAAAEAVLLRTPSGPGYYALLARSHAYRANASRAGGRLRSAEQQIRLTRRVAEMDEEEADPRLFAELDAIEGVLRKDQRRFEEAETLLVRSVTLYQLVGEAVEASRVMLALALMYGDMQETGRAIDTVHAALGGITPESEPRLYCYARHNLTLFLCDAGRYREAESALCEHRDLYAEWADRYTRVRLPWLEGRIAAGLERFEEAERAFLKVRKAFLRRSIGYDAAMVSLDLALLYLRTGRLPQVYRLAWKMHALFEAEDIHREAAAALLLFQEAARQEAVTAELVEDLNAYLRRARKDPELRFLPRG